MKCLIIISCTKATVLCGVAWADRTVYLYFNYYTERVCDYSGSRNSERTLRQKRTD